MFDLGSIHTTEKINDEIEDDTTFAKELTECLKNYRRCEWGKIDRTTAKINNKAVRVNNKTTLRLYEFNNTKAVYSTSKGKVLIETIWHHEATTKISFENDY